MELTNEFIEGKGFKKINNSMWRKDKMTLQNAYTHEGKTIEERILNTKKAFKACFKGKFICFIDSEQKLNQVLLLYFIMK